MFIRWEELTVIASGNKLQLISPSKYNSLFSASILAITFSNSLNKLGGEHGMYVLVYGSIDGFITGPEVAYNKVEELISAVLTVCLFLLLQINYQRNICLPLGVPSVIYHRVTSRTIVSSNRNPVFICFVR